MTGVRTQDGVVGMDATASRGQCREARGREVATLLEDAKEAGLAAGLVTTDRVTRAAAAYAHVTDVNWEVDANMPQNAIAEGCRDIARQLVEFDHRGGLDVVLGGGRLAFAPGSRPDPRHPRRFGVRRDGRDLVAEWRARNPDSAYLKSAEQLTALDPSVAAGPVLGLFSPDRLGQEKGDGEDEPSLSVMTERALQLLGRRPAGFVLVVVADAGTAEASRAMQAAMAATRSVDTLVVVAGNSARGPGSPAFAGVSDPLALYALMRAAVLPPRTAARR
ncbi:alkaline phosphatase [uncultured Phenylobacterium sp.]|uniref:alkaline phosphatase n=1 Tax=uncultured Phenylobacterium sp. TaxID=349273 RepID=UPI0025EB0EFE|nr:alkaline phosphatase [uncultured Phenylobacterium sp.]